MSLPPAEYKVRTGNRVNMQKQPRQQKCKSELMASKWTLGSGTGVAGSAPIVLITATVKWFNPEP
jgi:hypothetical protein